MGVKIAVAGAGIYGATAAIRLAEQGHQVHLFDPLGVLRAASAINQYRVHAGYHYPRSAETICEIAEARAAFTQSFGGAIFRNSRHFHAIPEEHTLTPPDLYECVVSNHGLPLRQCRPEWMNFDFIDRCYEVEENIYEPDLLRALIEARLKAQRIRLREHQFTPEMRPDYEFVVWATYGLGPSRGLFNAVNTKLRKKC
jgi:hypothetical protein